MRMLCLTWLAVAPVWCPCEPSGWVSRETWGSRPTSLTPDYLHEPRRLVLHHAGVVWQPGQDPIQKLRALQSWGQRDKGWPDVPYHFLIAPDGRIFEGRELRFRPESNTDYNLEGVVNIHLWGDFEQQTVQLPQLQATVELLKWLGERHGLRELSTHLAEAPGQTTCPGRDLQRYLPLLEEWTEAGTPRVLPPLPDGPTKPIAP